MTPKDKAKELVDWFLEYRNNAMFEKHQLSIAKTFALKCVEEMLKSGFGSRKIEYFYASNSSKVVEPKKYWNEVKEEISNL